MTAFVTKVKKIIFSKNKPGRKKIVEKTFKMAIVALARIVIPTTAGSALLYYVFKYKADLVFNESLVNLMAAIFSLDFHINEDFLFLLQISLFYIISIFILSKGKRNRFRFSKKTKKIFLHSLNIASVLIFIILTSNFALFQSLKTDISKTACNINRNPDAFVFDLQQINFEIENESVNKINLNSDLQNSKIVLRELSENNDYSKFYKENLASTMPDVLFEDLRVTENKNVFIYDNTLYIGKWDIEIGEALAFSLGKFLTKEYWTVANQDATSAPVIRLIKETEYRELRHSYIDQLIGEYDESIANIRELIKVREKFIEEDKYHISNGGTGMWSQWLREDEHWLSEYKNLLQAYIDGKNLLENKKDTINLELGLYTPEDKEIILVMLDDEAYLPYLYLETLAHEYLHFLSQRHETSLNRFIDEGITEYLAQKVLQQKCDESYFIGYTNPVRIINLMIEDIGEEKMLDIYFRQSETELEQILNKVYGQDFFKNNMYKFNHILSIQDEEADKMTEEIIMEIK